MSMRMERKMNWSLWAQCKNKAMASASLIDVDERLMIPPATDGTDEANTNGTDPSNLNSRRLEKLLHRH